MKKTMFLTTVLMFTASLVFASFVNPPFPITKGGTGSASQTASRAVTTDSNGHLVSSSSTTDTEIGFVHNVTSAIQTQLNAKQSSTLTSAHLLVGNGSNVATDVAATGDLSLANTGAFTLATVNSNVGS